MSLDVDVFGVLGLYVIWGLTFIYEFILRRSLAMLEGHSFSYKVVFSLLIAVYSLG